MTKVANPYRTIHKAHRAQLFALCADIGRCETTVQALQPLVKRARDIITGLREHISHEDDSIHRLLGMHAPEIVEELGTQHEHLELAFEQLAAVGAHITSLQTDDVGEWGHKLYLTLSRLISTYLAHMYIEETIAWPALARTADNHGVLSQRMNLSSPTGDLPLHTAADEIPHVTQKERILIISEALAATPHHRRPHIFAFLTAQLDSDTAEDLRAALGLRHS
ncbi:hypothetical protein ACWGLF_39540 [Streptomyces puniciscabiei]